MKGRIHWFNDPDSDTPRIVKNVDLERWISKHKDEHFIVYPMSSPIPKRK